MQNEVLLRNSNVYLVGPMGAGKTTIGKLLAEELGRPLFDTDKEVEIRAGADVRWIFDVEGESGFRARESKVLEDISKRRDLVISTGGGIVLSLANRSILKAGLCVYLRAELAQLVSRVGKDKRRPLLQLRNPREVLEEIMRVREPMYMDVATWVINTDSRPPRHLVREIIRLLESTTSS